MTAVKWLELMLKALGAFKKKGSPEWAAWAKPTGEWTTLLEEAADGKNRKMRYKPDPNPGNSTE